MSVYKPGMCLNCEGQAMVTDTMNRPIRGLSGTTVCELILDYPDDGFAPTAVGKIYLCENCDPSKMKPKELLQKLIDMDGSGVGQEPEFDLNPTISLSVVKRFEVYK